MNMSKIAIVSSIILAFAVLAGAAEQPGGQDLIEGQPRMTVSGQTAEISFVVKEYTDVAVEVVDAKGQVIRHLGSAVLGPNAPAPFQKDSKSQAISWDLKDNAGNPVDPKGDARVLVRAGLKPSFGGTFGGTGQTLGIIKGMAVDKEGNLYVTSKSTPITYRIHTITKVFDREGKYLRTIIPFPADLPEEKLKGIQFADLPDGKRAPLMIDFFERRTHEKLHVEMHQPLISRDGKLFFPSFDREAPGGKGSSFLANVGVDGSVGTDFVGPVIARHEAPFDLPFRHKAHPRAFLAASPDERYVYVSGIGRGGNSPRPGGVDMAGFDNCVYRIDRQAREDAVPFIGEKFSKDGLLSNPLGIDVDGEGNIYVCDYGHNRIAVFTPQGALKQEFPFERPIQVFVHPSGKIYVYTSDRLAEGENINGIKLTHRVVRLGGVNNPAKEAEIEWPNLSATIQLTVALDKNSPKPILWIGSFSGQNGYFWYRGDIRKIVDNGEALEELGDVITAKAADPQLGRSQKFILVDPKTEEVWWSHLIFNGETGELIRKFQAKAQGRFPIGTPGNFGAGEPRLGPDDSVIFWGKNLTRFKRDGAPLPFSSTGSHEIAIENFRGQAGRNFSRGIDVDDKGTIYILGSAGYAESKRQGIVKKIAPDGTITEPNLIQIDESVGGLAVDRRGSIYLGAHVKEVGRVLPTHWETYFTKHPNPLVEGKYQQTAASVVKFSPSGGGIRLDAEGQDFQGRPAREIQKFKATGVTWSRFVNSVDATKCNCEVTDMEVDGHNRIFMPDALTYSILVFDENGNEITRFGGYGNMDSATPGSDLGRPEIPLSYAFRLGVSNKAVYINDSQNQRVVKVNLGYKATAAINMDGSPGEAPVRK